MTENIQESFLRVHPPRVRITYEVETGGSVEKKELPFIVGLLADLSGDREKPDEFPPLKARKMVDIDRDNFNDVMQTIGPRVDLASILPALADLAESQDPQDKAIVFRTLADFEPLRIIDALPALRAKYLARAQLQALQAKAASDAANAKVLDMGTADADPAALEVIGAQLLRIDRHLSEALAAILRADSFKAVEQTWRGLAYLVSRTESGPMLRLRVFDATKDELHKDLEMAVACDQSALFKMVYEAEYGTYGGCPYGLLVGGYEVDGSGDDMAFLTKIAEVAASAHAPFIAAASAKLFGLPGFDKLDKPRDLKKIFESADLTAWREFREREEARYVALVLPRVLLRPPYGAPEKRNAVPGEGFHFEESMGEGGTVPDHSHFLWGNAAYVLAERITHAFALYGWTAAIRGVEGGGLVEGLPVYRYTSDTGTTELRCPTEVSISERRHKELNDLGFIALCHCKGSDQAAFFGGQTTMAPKKYFSDEANANARTSATLPYMLAASRFAHYVKVIMRNKVGSFLTRANVENHLNTWISNYVLLDDKATQEVKAAYPLRQATVVVTEVPGEPGAYRATVVLKPHFQLEELTASIRLQADLPP